MDSTPVFAMVLAGHPDLSRLLSRRGNEALAQRGGCRFHLTGMDWEEIQHSQGVPWRVNGLALQALEVAYLQEKELVDGGIVELVTADVS